MTGLLNILKIPGMTSHDVVGKLRSLTKIKRIGHAGTLDPQAAGVLPVCIGSSTKMIPFMDHSIKTYRVEMKLGVKTDTQDTTGEILTQSATIPSMDLVEKTLESMVGVYWQTPPMYSAIKHKGKKLYELARAGKTIEREPRKKTIYQVRWISGQGDTVFFDVDCSEGTYVRTLCDDVGNLLGCGAAMSFLLRTESCRLSIENTVTLTELEHEVQWTGKLMPVDVVLGHYPKAVVNNKLSKKILNGVSVTDFDYVDDISCQPHCVDIASERNITRVYLEELFIGMGKLDFDSNELSMLKLLPQPLIDQTD